ncbi:MAG: hypothetical protein ACPGSB_09715 [Opitutales bacterium]
MNKPKISSKHLSYKCPLKWSDLAHDGEAHYCNQCEREILDLTDCSIDDVMELQKEKGLICGLVRAAAVSSLVGLSACSTTKQADTPPSPERHEPAPGQIEGGEEFPMMLGVVCPPEMLEHLKKEAGS